MFFDEKEVVGDGVDVVGWRRRTRHRLKCISRSVWSARYELAIPFAVLFAGVLMQWLAALFPELTERLYARAVYPRLLVLLSMLSRRFSFSIGEVLTFFLLATALACVLRFCFLLYFRPEERPRRVVAFARFTLWIAAAFLWTFLLCFGFNYERAPLFVILGYEQRSATTVELEMMTREVVLDLNESYEKAHAVGRNNPGREEIVNILEESYNSVPDLLVLPRGVYAAPKPVLSSEVMSRLGVSGIYCPFTGEANFNADVPDFQLPFTMAHEMAHQRGVARESEANFVAYLVCISSRDPFVRYSGYRNGLGVAGELYRLDPEKGRELIKQLSPGFREDSRRAAAFWMKASGAAGALGLRVNDLYLRANRVKSGVADYRSSTALIIGFYLRQMNLDGRDRAFPHASSPSS
jgi:hypothetical protein